MLVAKSSVRVEGCGHSESSAGGLGVSDDSQEYLVRCGSKSGGSVLGRVDKSGTANICPSAREC